MRILFLSTIAVGCSPGLKDTAILALAEEESWEVLFESGTEERWLFEAGATDVASQWNLAFEGQMQVGEAPSMVDWTIFAGAPLSNEGEILQEGRISTDAPNVSLSIELPECTEPPCGASLITKWIAEAARAVSIRLTVTPSSQEMNGLSVAAARLQ